MSIKAAGAVVLVPTFRVLGRIADLVVGGLAEDIFYLGGGEGGVFSKEE